MSEAPPRRRSLRNLALELAAVVAVFLGVQWWQARPLASGPAPVLRGKAVTGGALDLAALRGRPVLVHFWGTWCPVCRAEQANIQALAADYPVLSVAMQSGSAADVRRFMQRRGVGFPVLNDPRGEIAGDWGVHSVPTSFVLDPGGRIRYHAVGYTTEAGLRARLWAAGRL
jgi:peroxiredoxin